jgi:predicted nucleic acid-binding protein
MKTLFLDTNIVLDLVLENREGHRQACQILKMVEDQDIALVCSWHTLAILEYVGLKRFGSEIFQILDMIVDLFEIPETGKSHAKEAFLYLNADYEDAMQIVSALASGASCIVTNDRQGGFEKSPLPILSSTEILQK